MSTRPPADGAHSGGGISPSHITWSMEETKALVKLIALERLERQGLGNGDVSEWPASKDTEYWAEMSRKLKLMAGTSYLREGMSLRSKTGKLRARYNSIDEAERELGITVEEYMDVDTPPQGEPAQQQTSLPELLRIVKSLSAPQRLQLLMLLPSSDLLTWLHRTADVKELQHIMVMLFQVFLEKAPKAVAAELLDAMTDSLLKHHGFSDQHVVTNTLASMSELSRAGITPNLVGKFAECIVRKRPDNKDSLMPLHRMPFALIQYQIQFFTAGHVSKVKEAPAFQLWRETLAAELTGSQNLIFRGPGWSGRGPTDNFNPLTARVNVACVGTRTTNQRLAKASDTIAQPVIQKSSIAALVKAGVTRVWIKCDATDIKVCLQHSTRGVWEGDEDLGNGHLDTLRRDYDKRVGSFQDGQVNEVVSDLDKDLVFIRDGLAEALNTYQKLQARKSGRASSLTEAMWDVADYNILLQQAESFRQQLSQQTGKGKLSIVKGKEEYYKYLAELYKKHRRAASHVLVFLASDEKRNRKPYSIPLQYIPIRSIRDQYIRDFTKPLKEALKAAGILVIGTVTDGEFCSLRSLGDTRPIHLWQVIRDAKMAVSRFSKDHLEGFLFPAALTVDGDLVMGQSHPAIPHALILQMHARQRDQGWSRQQCISEQRAALVPAGFQPYPFRRNTPESYLDSLRSLVGTLVLRQAIQEWDQEGVDFRKHLYVPEVDKITGQPHHERADHGHLLKRIAGHTRELRYVPLTQEPFVQAMRAPDTGLTHAALAGLRKQSVSDAERLLSHRVAAHMRQQGHQVAAEYIQIIADWHEASDGRGLTEEQRSQKNKRMLKYLVEDFMPWFETCHDFSLVDLNRPMDDIRGFSRETFVETTTNIESQEMRRELANVFGPEHPRASTTDDVEGFFAICHRYLGTNFTLQEFKHRWVKIVNEFGKKSDPELPFYYWTATDRYTEEEPGFNDPLDLPEDPDPRKDPRRLHRLIINRREDASVFSANRVYLPQRHAQTLRQKFHVVPAELPQVPQHLLPAALNVDAQMQ